MSKLKGVMFPSCNIVAFQGFVFIAHPTKLNPRIKANLRDQLSIGLNFKGV